MGFKIKLRKETNLYEDNAIANGIAEGASRAVENQTQTDIFNKLTNNGTIRGIYMQNGQMYVNMDYLQTGTLKLGGVNNTNGLLEVYNSSGTKVGSWDKDGLTAKSLTANDYIYVDGNSNSYFKIPYTYLSKSGYIIISSGGFVVAYADGKLSTNGYKGYGLANLPTASYPLFRFKHTDGKVYTDVTPVEVFVNNTYGYSTMDSTVRADSLVIGRTGSSNTDAYFSVNREGADARIRCNMAVSCSSSLSVSGTKNRVVSTKDYGERLLYSYETPSPLFGDIGEGTISEDGKCHVMIDSVFAETVSLKQYQVMIQKYGNGDCWVSERNESYFIVEGTPNLSFGWELKAKQSDFNQLRLEQENLINTISNTSDRYAGALEEHIRDIQHEREVA